MKVFGRTEMLCGGRCHKRGESDAREWQRVAGEEVWLKTGVVGEDGARDERGAVGGGTFAERLVIVTLKLQWSQGQIMGTVLPVSVSRWYVLISRLP